MFDPPPRFFTGEDKRRGCCSFLRSIRAAQVGVRKVQKKDPDPHRSLPPQKNVRTGEMVNT
jgi:hypothetical protein